MFFESNFSLICMGDRLCRVVCKFVFFFDSEIVSPVGDFDVSLEMLGIRDWSSKFIVNLDLLKRCSRILTTVGPVR